MLVEIRRFAVAPRRVPDTVVGTVCHEEAGLVSGGPG